jgi:bacteriocin biosynthesis cyclodehydratase domain-containing protein
MSILLQRRPRLAYPFTIIPRTDAVLLVAGEDYRYTLSGPGLGDWLPQLLARCDGGRTLEVLLESVKEKQRALALELMQQLYGERVLVDGPALAAHKVQQYRLVIEGTGPMRDLLAKKASEAPGTAVPLFVFCQDRLDYAAALEWDRHCRQEGRSWMWVSHGPMERGFVGPLFLAEAGPCFGCLLRSFQRVSPAPEVYDALLVHQQKGGKIEPVPFPPEGLAVLEKLVRWKAALASDRQPPAARYRLHVLERESMEVSSHRVLVDPECPFCRELRL